VGHRTRVLELRQCFARNIPEEPSSLIVDVIMSDTIKCPEGDTLQSARRRSKSFSTGGVKASQVKKTLAPCAGSGRSLNATYLIILVSPDDVVCNLASSNANRRRSAISSCRRAVTSLRKAATPNVSPFGPFSNWTLNSIEIRLPLLVAAGKASGVCPYW
jgi:hypothetical protein